MAPAPSTGNGRVSYRVLFGALGVLFMAGLGWYVQWIYTEMKDLRATVVLLGERVAKLEARR